MENNPLLDQHSTEDLPVNDINYLGRPSKRGWVKILFFVLILFLFLISAFLIYRAIFAPKSDEEKVSEEKVIDENSFSQQQEEVSEEETDYEEFGNVESIEYYEFLGTGDRDLTYIYWDTDKYVYHLNPIWSLDDHIDVECLISSDIIEQVDSEFIKTYRLLIESDTTYDIHGSGSAFILTFSSNKQVVVFTSMQKYGIFERKTSANITDYMDLEAEITHTEAKYFDTGLNELLSDMKKEVKDKKYSDGLKDCRNLDVNRESEFETIYEH